MSADLERAIRSYAEYLDQALSTVTADDSLAADVGRPQAMGSHSAWYRRPVVVFVAAMVAVLLIALLPVVFFGASGTDVVDQPISTPVAPQPPSATALEGLEGPVQVDTSGGDVWAWEHDGNRIWRYADGRWEELPAAPVFVSGVVSVDGTPWVLTDGVIRYLDGDTWHQPDVPTSVRAWRIAADPSSETLWLSTGERLYRWDGEAATEVDVDPVDDRYPDYTYVGEIAVTSDGTVWAAGLHGYAPMLGVLASYEPDTGVWEAVTPWNDKPVPAGLLAPTSTGGLWVLLEEWDDDESADALHVGWALAYRHGDTGTWDVYDEDLPDGSPFAIATDSEGVWLAQGYALLEGSKPMLGLYHFDGLAWTHYLEEVEVLDVAIAPDGTVWYMADQEPYVLRPLEP
jgi:hypothetical protein